VDELKAIVIDKENIIGMLRSDLVKLNTQKNQLEQSELNGRATEG